MLSSAKIAAIEATAATQASRRMRNCPSSVILARQRIARSSEVEIMAR